MIYVCNFRLILNQSGHLREFRVIAIASSKEEAKAKVRSEAEERAQKLVGEVASIKLLEMTTYRTFTIPATTEFVELNWRGYSDPRMFLSKDYPDAIEIAAPRTGLYLCCRKSELRPYVKPCDEAYKVLIPHINETTKESWAVELPTLADFMAFTAKYGQCLVTPRSENWPYDAIDIFDEE